MTWWPTILKGCDSREQERGGGDMWRPRGKGGREKWEGVGAVVGWTTATWEQCSWAGGGVDTPHGRVPADRGGGATDVWAWP
jgi:hypothetical protein